MIELSTILIVLFSIFVLISMIMSILDFTKTYENPSFQLSMQNRYHRMAFVALTLFVYVEIVVLGNCLASKHKRVPSLY